MHGGVGGLRLIRPPSGYHALVMASHHLDDETYALLRDLAHRIFAQRGRTHATVQPTVLLHEAWLKLDQGAATFHDREHFLAVAARAMRQILIDRARRKSADKRGANPVRTTLADVADPHHPLDVLELDRALTELAAVDEAAADIAMMRTFGGMTIGEVADASGRSKRSVDRLWRFARVFLMERLGSAD
ncbi:MAG: ECF-type sigma factor [Myxococcota bacterium]